MNQWINSEIPDIANQLANSIVNETHIDADEGLNVSGRNDVYRILDDILSVLFPGAFSKNDLSKYDLDFFINDRLRHICRDLSTHIRDGYNFHCHHDNCGECNCEDKSITVTRELIKSLPEIRNMLLSDIRSAFDGDPASKSLQEVILSYPFVEVIATHRIAHKLYTLGVPVIPRIMSERAHSRTGIDIHPGAKIGRGFFIDHGTGVVIGETCNIGQNVTIYHGVTLGAFSPFDREGNKYRGKKRHPDIEDNVIIYSGAVILGGDTVIGENSVIGGNTWITRSVPKNSMVYSKFNTVFKEDKSNLGHE